MKKYVLASLILLVGIIVAYAVASSLRVQSAKDAASILSSALKKELLFSIPLAFESNLVKSESIPKDLRQHLRNKGLSPHQKAYMRIENEGSRWLMIENDKVATYFIRKEKGKLNVYKAGKGNAKLAILYGEEYILKNHKQLVKAIERLGELCAEEHIVLLVEYIGMIRPGIARGRPLTPDDYPAIKALTNIAESVLPAVRKELKTTRDARIVHNCAQVIRNLGVQVDIDPYMDKIYGALAGNHTYLLITMRRTSDSYESYKYSFNSFRPTPFRLCGCQRTPVATNTQS